MDVQCPKRVGKSLSPVSSIQRPIGRFSVVLLFSVLCLTFGATASAAVDASNKIFVIRGKIQAVDVAAGTLTLQVGRHSYVFVVTDQTRIVTKGRAQKFADLKQGQFAEVEMKIGPGGKGMAVLIQLGFSSSELNSRIRTLQFQAFFSGTGPDGKTISAKRVDPSYCPLASDRANRALNEIRLA